MVQALLSLQTTLAQGSLPQLGIAVCEHNPLLPQASVVQAF
jgi:hypothetical protein